MISKAEASVMRELEISGWSLRKVVQAENGICKICEESVWYKMQLIKISYL